MRSERQVMPLLSIT